MGDGKKKTSADCMANDSRTLTDRGIPHILVLFQKALQGNTLSQRWGYAVHKEAAFLFGGG